MFCFVCGTVWHNEDFCLQETNIEHNPSETKSYGNWLRATEFGKKIKDTTEIGDINNHMTSPATGIPSPNPEGLIKITEVGTQ